jgi:hypothetical protein
MKTVAPASHNMNCRCSTLLLANIDTVASSSLVDWHQQCLQLLKQGLVWLMKKMYLKIEPWLADTENLG